MPTYDYTCKKHGLFTASASLANFDAPHNCPDCNQPSPRNLISAPLISNQGPRPKANKTVRTGRTIRHAPGCACCS